MRWVGRGAAGTVRISDAARSGQPEHRDAVGRLRCCGSCASVMPVGGRGCPRASVMRWRRGTGPDPAPTPTPTPTPATTPTPAKPARAVHRPFSDPQIGRYRPFASASCATVGSALRRAARRGRHDGIHQTRARRHSGVGSGVVRGRRCRCLSACAGDGDRRHRVRSPAGRPGHGSDFAYHFSRVDFVARVWESPADDGWRVDLDIDVMRGARLRRAGRCTTGSSAYEQRDPTPRYHRVRVHGQPGWLCRDQVFWLMRPGLAVSV